MEFLPRHNGRGNARPSEIQIRIVGERIRGSPEISAGTKRLQVERQVLLPIYWDDVQLDQTYKIDLVINDNIICELKAVKHTTDEHVRQLWNYMRLTQQPYGMLINFGSEQLYSEYYSRDAHTGYIIKIGLK